MATKITKEKETKAAAKPKKAEPKKTTEKAKAGAKGTNDTKLVFKVTFTDWDAREKGMPYRVIAVSPDCTLYKLAEFLNKSFEFKLDQPFGFYNNLTNWEKATKSFSVMNDEGDIDEKPLKKTLALDVFTEKGMKLLYIFDYADEWRFLIEFVGEEKMKSSEKTPFVMESVGDAPVQDGADLDDDDDDDDIFGEEDDDDDIFSDSPKPTKKKKDADDEFNVDEFDEFAKGGFDDFGGGGFDDFDDKF